MKAPFHNPIGAFRRKAVYNYDIYVEKGSVTLAGDFTLKTYGTAVFSEHDMVFKSGTFALYGKSPSAITSYNKAIFESGVKRVELSAERKTVGTFSGIILADNLLVTSPDDFEITGRNIEIDHVIIGPCAEYDLWLGSTRVTNKNKRNILGDGKASYDVDTQTLTLDNPTISEPYDQNGETCFIHSETDLTIKGSFNPKNSFKKGVDCLGNLTLDGIFSFPATDKAVTVSKNMTVRSGLVAAQSEGSAIVVTGSLTFEEGAEKLEAHMKSGGIAAGSFVFGNQYIISEPKGASVGDNGKTKTIRNADGSIALDVVIAPKTPTVSFEMNGFGSAVEAQVLAYGEKASEPKAPTADHCYFGGWFTDKACTKAFDFDTPVMDDLTLYAKWTFKKYTITFVNEDDTVLQQSDVEYGTMPEYKGETPVKKPDAQSYYAFTGWTPAISKVTAEVTYRATFRKNARKLLIGDANGDGKVTVNDVTKIQEYLADLAQLTPDQVIAADTNCDGRVTIDDATNIQKYLAEIIDHLG